MPGAKFYECTVMLQEHGNICAYELTWYKAEGLKGSTRCALLWSVQNTGKEYQLFCVEHWNMDIICGVKVPSSP